MKTNNSYNLVLGISGGLGAAVGRELVKQNHNVIGINRSGKVSPLLVPQQVEVKAVDVWDTENILPLMKGAEKIYQCINLPYSKWNSDLVDLTQHIIELVEKAGTPIIISDNLYMYHEDAGKSRSENMSYNSQISKGMVRAEVANLYFEAHETQKIQMVQIRGPSFYGVGSLNTSHYGDRIFKPILQGKRTMFVGDPEVVHTTIHVGDFARAMILLGEDETAYGQAWHAPCAPAMKKSAFTDLAYQLAGFDSIPPRRVPTILLTLLGIFNKDMAELKEMLYEFDQPYFVDDRKFRKKYPDFKVTSVSEGIMEAIEWYRKYLEIEPKIPV